MDDTEYTITTLAKEDILDNETINYDGRITAEMLTDDVMERIASKLADDYYEQLFWTSLGIMTNHVLGLDN